MGRNVQLRKPSVLRPNESPRLFEIIVCYCGRIEISVVDVLFKAHLVGVCDRCLRDRIDKKQKTPKIN